MSLMFDEGEYRTASEQPRHSDGTFATKHLASAQEVDLHGDGPRAGRFSNNAIEIAEAKEAYTDLTRSVVIIQERADNATVWLADVRNRRTNIKAAASILRRTADQRRILRQLRAEERRAKSEKTAAHDTLALVSASREEHYKIISREAAQSA